MSGRDLPPVPKNLEHELQKLLLRIREEVQGLAGWRGDGTQRALTAGESTGGGTSITVINPGSGGGSSGSPDPTPPPSPSALAIEAGIMQVTVSWSGLGYTQGHGHKQTVIYAVKRDPASTAPLPVFGDAQVVATAPNALTLISIPSEPNLRWYVWAKFETNDGYLSVVPAGGTNGVTGTTGQDIAHLLEVLTGKVTASQLYYDLAQPITRMIEREDEIAASALGGLLAAHAEAGNRAAAIAEERVARADADSAEAAAREVLVAQVNDPSTGLVALRARIATEEVTRADADSALAESVSTLSATVDGNTAAISVEAGVRASADGYLGAQYTVRADINGFVVGYGFSATSTPDAGPTSQFLVRVDQFAVVPPTQHTGPTAPATPALNDRWFRTTDRVVLRWDGSAWVTFNTLPFVVQATPTTVNGVTIPAGVYMDAAYILNLQATYAQISNLVADTITVAELNAAKLTLGDGSIGGRLKSTTFSSGEDGWIIRPDGTAEFNDIIARGEIYAPAALIQGVLVAGQINANGLNVSRSDGRVLIRVDNETPPWVVNGVSIGGAIELVLPLEDDSNSMELRSVRVLDGLEAWIGPDGELCLASKSSDDGAIRLDDDLSTTSTALADVPGFLLPLEANTSYRIEGTLRYKAAASTTGLKIGGRLPSTATGVLRFQANVSETTQESRVLNIPADGANHSVTFSGTWAADPASPSVFSAAYDALVSFEGIIVAGFDDGSFQLVVASEVGGSAITVEPAGTMLVERVRMSAVAPTFGLEGSPGVSASYDCTAASITGKPRSAGLRFTLSELGTWSIERVGSTPNSGTGTPDSGNWASPTGLGAGSQWQVIFETMATSTGDASISNGAASYQSLASPRSYTVTVFSDTTTSLQSDVVTLRISLRNVASGAVTTLATIDLQVDAETT